MLNLHRLALNQACSVNIHGVETPVIIIRVPGGWIYRFNDNATGNFESVYVPYSTQFDSVNILSKEEHLAALEDAERNQQQADIDAAGKMQQQDENETSYKNPVIFEI